MVMSHLVSVGNQNSSPLEEQPGLITTEPSPVPFSKNFFYHPLKVKESLRYLVALGSFNQLIA